MKSARPYRRDEGSHQIPDELQPSAALENARQHLAAIVEGSDDAILTKDLNGFISSWNRGAERIFGYTAEEVIGAPVTILIPSERHDEEAEILARIRRGERVDHYETVRQRKDGQLIQISLTVSPLHDDRGNVVGASKIARDITERHLAQEQQRLLLRAMQHRIKNVFALADSLTRISASRAENPAQMADVLCSRFHALAQAHSLSVPLTAEHERGAIRTATLHELISTLAAPCIGDEADRLQLLGDDLQLSPKATSPLALVLNELLTNAAKHGALQADDGSITVKCARCDSMIIVHWLEKLGTPVSDTAINGFGTRLADRTAQSQLGGRISRNWTDDGLSVTLHMDPKRIEDQ